MKKVTAGRGSKAVPTATSHETPRAVRGGGRGRRGGRGGSRPSKPEPVGDSTCLLVFDSIINALDSRLSGSSAAPFQVSSTDSPLTSVPRRQAC